MRLYLLTHFLTGWDAAFHWAFWKSGLFTGQVFTTYTTRMMKLQIILLPLSRLLMFGGEWMERNKQVTTWLTTHSLALRWSAYYALIIWVLAFGYYAQRTFIYFQF